MTREEWARLEEIFEDAVRQPPTARASWLRDRCPDGALRTVVTEMLAAYDSDPEFLEVAPDVPGAVAAALADGLVGSRLGPYRVSGQLGRGGMGVVYEAVRDDGDFERRVAIKVLPAWSGAALNERFRLERRVLASLEHPGIARLVDSGTTPDGAPYFVMELVDGQPIDVWARTHALDVEARVGLVERVCDAVAYAHQHLVIHRDIKPANILVPADGQPRLLDFGIATLLTSPDGTDVGMTKTGHHSFTVDFASPEQIKGEAVTTASDVYSLGVLLFLLVTGRRPYALQGLSPLEAMRTVCELDAARPSKVAAGADAAKIRGDLDAVIGKALRKAPRDRYSTVAALAADLRAWVSGLPVTAAPESRAKRARRFVRRNKAAAAVLAAIVVGGGVATWQAQVAATQRDRAERRFAQVREFSRSLIFDVNGALSKVPGNTDARRLVLDRAVQFLDGLAADAATDETLAQELVAGYRRLGNIQGDVQSRNLGDASAAVASYEKAVSIAEALVRARPTDLRRVELTADTLDELWRARRYAGQPDAGASARRLELVARLEREHQGDPVAVAAAARGYSDAGLEKAAARDLEAARRFYERAIALWQVLPAAELAKDRRDGTYAFTLKRLGAVLLVQGQREESERRYREALAIDEDVLRRSTGDADVEYALTFTLSDLGSVLSQLGRLDESAALWQRALEIRQRAADADPKDVRALGGVATLEYRFASAAMRQGQYDEAVRRSRRVLSLRERLLTMQGPLAGTRTERGWAALGLSEALLRLADTAASARESALRKREAAELLAALTPGDVTTSVVSGDPDDFVERLRAARRAVNSK